MLPLKKPIRDLQEPVAAPVNYEGLRLSDLPAGTPVRVVGLTEDCQGFARRRLLDLGLSPGAVVERRYSAPLGGPTAYRLRGVTLALRPDQTRMVAVREVS